MPNYNTSTGISYGVIALNSLADWFNDEMYDLDSPEEREAFNEFIQETAADLVREKKLDFDDLDCESGDEQQAIADCDPDILQNLVEAADHHVIDSFWAGTDFGTFRREGIVDGVSISTSELGGAILVWVIESPHIGRYAPCSPCIPGAGDLDSPDPDGIECYDVPPGWRMIEE